MEAARLHEYTEDMEGALSIDEVAEKLERREIEGRVVIRS